ncbi:MAG: class II fumarate hydratase [Kiritimatiellia bacterium]|jgi:fumarate hydratase class II|nr:class II fumarate hydratase [Kiritimatiellia bacterium]MDP6847281.1 class II fumarate hydratase [Kiritimatiellia bacterium]
MNMRREKDSLGEVLVPEDRYYGAQTQRAIDNFRIGNELIPTAFIRSLAVVKMAAAVVNRNAGALDKDLAEAIAKAAGEVRDGKLDAHFPLVIWQSGSGTQTNMNMNEVIANRANEMLGGDLGSKSPVHPNDHVNMAQSTNDTVPTAMHVAGLVSVREKLLPAVLSLKEAFDEKANDFKDIVKIGRTHLQDATPIKLGQELSGYSAQLAQAAAGIDAAVEPLSALAIGGTAVGTGLNTVEGYDEKMAREISSLTGHEFSAQPNKYAGMAAHDAIVGLSGALKVLACALMKIANDIRWLGSGPRSGLGEISLPSNEPGSSIMPGKINPTQCEMVIMVACKIYGNDLAIGLAGSQGNFELNVLKPLLVHLILQSIDLLTDACTSFREKCISGITPNEKRIAGLVDGSLMLVTALSKHIGYDKASRIALKAWREDKTLCEAAVELQFVTVDEFKQWVRPEEMTEPDQPGGK